MTHFCRMNPLRLTLWGDFAEVEGTYIQQHLADENILLASRVHIRQYEGNFTSTKLTNFHYSDCTLE